LCGNFTAILEDRRKTILNNLEEATQRALEAEEKLNQAHTQLELAKKKLKIFEEFLVQHKEINTVVNQHEIQIAKLQNLKKKLFHSTNKALKKLIYM
jgi:DNA repair exonuclease SbcCD ATPase subunit